MVATSSARLRRRGLWLEYTTLGWNVVGSVLVLIARPLGGAGRVRAQPVDVLMSARAGKTEAVQPPVCPNCGAQWSPAAESCSNCGQPRVPDEAQTLRFSAAELPASPPPDELPPRDVFGAAPVRIVLTLGVIGCVAGIALLGTGHLISGLVVAAFAIMLLVVFASEALGALRNERVVRWTAAAGGVFSRYGRRLAALLGRELRVLLLLLRRAGQSAGRRGLALAALVQLYGSAWSAAGAEVARCDLRRRRLRRVQGKLIRRLGEATYLADEELATELNSQAHAVAAASDQAERARRAAIERARERTVQHRGAAAGHAG